jgi:hypothetical protein
MKNLWKTVAFTLMVLLVLSSTATAKINTKASDIQVKINFFGEWGEILQNHLEFEKKEQPKIENGRVLIPLRKIAENFGYTVVFDHKTKKIDVTDFYGKKVALTLNSKKALVNNERVELDVPARVFNQITFVPLRFISENFDQAVKWDDKQRTVLIDNFTISTPEYLFNQKTLELSKRDASDKGKILLGEVPMSVDLVSMQVTKTKNGNDVIVINNNYGAPHIFFEVHTIYVGDNKIIDQMAVNTLFHGKEVLSSDGEKVVLGNGKIARVYDDKTKKLLNEYDLQNLFAGEKGRENDPVPDGGRETSYAVLGFGDNYILVRDAFLMLTKLAYLDAPNTETVDLYKVLLTEQEQEEALADGGPFGSGDRLTFMKEKDGKLIFQRSYDEGSTTKTKEVAYILNTKNALEDREQ